MSQVFEMLMMVLFGLSWPVNLRKSWISKTAKGKSLGFELLIAAGYVFGLAGKIISGNITYVIWVYLVNFLIVIADIILILRNQKLDADRAMDTLIY